MWSCLYHISPLSRGNAPVKNLRRIRQYFWEFFLSDFGAQGGRHVREENSAELPPPKR